ncbi:MAG: hypothetical protein E6I37_08945 [Chloroflexi bacterium]|nr:MAG: hypothetical protein E6I37_08945 [Chloroflexota bacterium]
MVSWTPVSVLFAVVTGTVSMSSTAVPVPPSTVVVQTAGDVTYGVVGEGVVSVTELTTPKAPIYHSRRLPPTVRVAVCVVPSLKVKTTVPTGVPANQLLVLALLSSRCTALAF